jgi:glyoxylase-like metal-dependent hydrolase (beta-lactamase superfamily II)
MRYRPQQWSTRASWRVYDAGEGEPWFGFQAVRGFEGVPEEILAVPLFGHTLGHVGVAVRSNGRWLLQAGDAYFFHEEMNLAHPYCTPGLRFYQWLMEKDRRARLWNQERLRELKRRHGDEVDLFSAHDVPEFERLAGHRAELPVPPPLRPVAQRPAGPEPTLGR